jgi:hypothetical protein
LFDIASDIVFCVVEISEKFLYKDILQLGMTLMKGGPAAQVKSLERKIAVCEINIGKLKKYIKKGKVKPLFRGKPYQEQLDEAEKLLKSLRTNLKERKKEYKLWLKGKILY